MSLQGHEKAARIMAEAFADRAEKVTALAESANKTNPSYAANLVSVAMTLGYLALSYQDAAERMEAAIRAEVKS